ncbi:hypothetical protein, partial [uncultured Brachyspira sp.]|uniref:hypothetical protein n=1 Tax=uncultured Brachyspira sp. TaxID=221953 RepID=UPI002606DF82
MKSARSIELLENDEVATIGDLTFSKNTDEYKFIDNYVNSQIKAYEKIHSGSGERFSHESGYPYYYVKNKDIITEPLVLDGVEYNKLKIDLDDEIKQKIVDDKYKEVFKVILRKNVVFDCEGRYIKEFIIYTQNNEIYNPIINFSNKCSNITNSRDTDFYIAFDKNLDFNPYNLYIKGELSIMYLLSQDALVAAKPTIKCDIIEARNTFKLHESDVKYFYKPDIITEEKIDNIDYYKMVFKISDSYTIPNDLNFTFTEHCFGNKWLLNWKKDSSHINGFWEGNNCQGKVNKKVINKCNTPCEIQTLGILNIRKNYGAWIMIKITDWNKRFLPNHDKGLGYSLWNNTTKKFKFLMKDGTIKDCSDYYNATVELSEVSKPSSKPNIQGYDNLPLKCVFHNLSVSNVNNMENIQKAVDKLYVEFYLPDQIKGVRLIFKTDTGSCNQSVSGNCPFNITGEYDTIEKICYEWETRIANNSRDIIIYLRKDLTDPFEEINWDPSTNAFEYIIKQQFYEITPNPNAATTLYTDYNITSSKIITADNITTMRSDLNMVSNNVDVIDYDVKELTTRVDSLNAEMGQVRTVMKYMQEDITQNRIIASTALAFSIVSMVGSAASIGMQLSSKGIHFISNASHTGYNRMGNFTAEASCGDYEMLTEGVRIVGTEESVLPSSATRSILSSTDISPVLTWSNSEYTKFIDLPFEDERNDPKITATSLYTTLDVCNQFRDSLKPLFKLLATKINEIESDFETALTNYINKNELTRDDKIDITVNVDKENNNILFEAEDNINTGLLVFQVYVGNDTKQFRRRVYVKVIEGQIEEYKGVQEDILVNDPATGENVSLKLLAHSEEDRVAYFPDIIINGKTITIESQNEYRIWGVVIEYNSFTRHLTFTPNDLAYRIDIEALDRKINALAEQSHSNDVAMASIQEEYATVNEVNEVLANNYVLKSELPDSNHWNLYYSIFTKSNQDIIENLISLQYDSNTKKLTYYDEDT